MRVLSRTSALIISFLFTASFGFYAEDQPGTSAIAEKGPVVFEKGIASWYAGEFDGKLTANGEIYDAEGISAAHKTLPFGTVVRVTNLGNSRQVDVRINDRGPYVGNRIIDLSLGAAEKIDMVESGIAPVTLEIIYQPAFPESAYNRPGDTGWVKLQLGAFKSAEWVVNRYLLLNDSGFNARIERAENGFYRLVVSQTAFDQLDEVIIRLSELDFDADAILVMGDTGP